MAKYYKILILTVLLLASSCHGWGSSGRGGSLQNEGTERLVLNAERGAAQGWSVQGMNGTTNLRVNAEVPGGIYTDLEANSILTSEIYHDYNDLENLWVGRTDWTYSRFFNVSAALLAKTKVVIVCEGLDTIADVYINGLLVGKGQNMFVRYVWDVKEALVEGENLIQVAFKSPVNYAYEQYVKHEVEQGYPVLPVSLVDEYRGENKAQMIRKVQAHFSWDWGPSYATSGIWQDIYLEGWDGAVIRDVMIFNTPSKLEPDETAGTTWTLMAKAYLAAAAIETGTLTFQRLGASGEAHKAEAKVTLEPKFAEKNGPTRKMWKEDIPVEVEMTVSGLDAKLWWPNGYGAQPLYNYRVQYVSDNRVETSTKDFRLGFRTIQPMQPFVNVSDPEKGRLFYLTVNGKEIYSKGSNSIPFHVLPERITEAEVAWKLRSAAELHTNVIRVWGGAMYETEWFYDYADELGIIVWEDFMFACAMYPATPDFLDNVLDEVETQVRRLQHRTSLGVWAANNENEGALRQNWYGTESRFETYKADFIKLYIDTIMGRVWKLDPSRDLLPSSPTNWQRSEDEGWISMQPGSILYGDTHPYNYASDSWDWNTFIRTRYASEFGYQSFPYIETLRSITDNFDEWTWHNDFAQRRQRHPKGQMEIETMAGEHLPIPADTNSPAAFPAMLYLAQVQQSISQKTQAESFRRLADKYDDSDGSGFNRGALYWQLNDIWEGCSWTGFEVNGRWKMLANYMKRTFHPVLPSPYKDANGNVIIELVSDSPTAITGTMTVRLFNLESMTPILQQTTNVTSEYMTSKEVYRIAAMGLQALGCGNDAVSPCIVYVTMPGVPDNFLWLHYPKEKSMLKDPNLNVLSVDASPDWKTFDITLTADQIAPFVFMNLRNENHGWFSDNGFIMVQSPWTVTYTSERVMTAQEVEAQLHIETLFDVTPLAP